MALAKRTRFMLVRSTRNANATEDNVEPYHISIFRRSSSMPPLPKRSSPKRTNNPRRDQEQPLAQSSTMVVAKYQQRGKEEASTSKFYKLNIQTMKKKSARIGMRLSSAFGLAAHTVDEHFNFQEQRFRAIDKFLRSFLRNVYISTEALRNHKLASENILTQVDVAEDIEELLDDKIPDLFQQFIRSKRLLLESAFTEFRKHVEVHVIHSINTLLKLFISPTNLIVKRHNKLLDYDSAQSAYEKVKDQQLKQAKQLLDLSKQTYEVLNNRLLEELPMLYETSCQILSICVKEFIRAYYRLMQQMKTNMQLVLNESVPTLAPHQLTWQQILERFTVKNNSAGEQFFQLTITAKNFAERLKGLSTTRISSATTNTYNFDKDTYLQTDDIRQLMRNRHSERELYIVVQDYTGYSNNPSATSRSELTVRSGDLVSILQRYDGDTTDVKWLVDNGITQGYLSRSVLTSFVPSTPSDLHSLPPPIPIRHDLRSATRVPLPLPRSNLQSTATQQRSTLSRETAGSEPCLLNSTHYVQEAHEQIYLNQVDCQLSPAAATSEVHQYATIDLDDSIAEQSNSDGQIYVALYDFNSHNDGVLSLCVGERLKVLQRFDSEGNAEWWFVTKINDEQQTGYVPANYIQAA